MKETWFTCLALAAGLALSGAAHAQVRIGVAGPLTGSSAAFGEQLKNGAEQAAADINAAGGILGQKIVLRLGDDTSRPERGVSVAKKFVADGVRFVIGHFNSSVSIPASDIYHANGVLQIAPASTSPTLTERKLWNVFRVSGRSDRQGEALGRHIAENMKGGKVAIVHDKTTYGKGLADEAKKTMNSLGMKEVMYEAIDPGRKDFSALISKFRQTGVDVVMFGGLHTEAGLLLRQMRGKGVDAVLLGGDGILSPDFPDIAGEAGDGALMSHRPDPARRPEAAPLVEKFKARRIAPDGYALYSYAAVQIIKEAAETARSLDPKRVAEVMRSGRTFQTAIGPISFDAKGDRTDADFVLYVWRKAVDGKLIYEPL